MPGGADDQVKYDLGVTRYVAKLWWDAPHDDISELFLEAGQSAWFGRVDECQIPVGRYPYDEVSPRCWGEFAWSRGMLDVTNVDDGHAFDVASLSDEGAPPIPMATVHPGARFGPPTGRFQVRGSVGPTSFLINAHAIKLDRPLPNLEMDPKTKGLVQLSEPQKAVGRALIRPFAEGKLRASYVAIARVTNYGKEAVRGHIASVDALFITHGLCPHPASGDALDRVASVLQRHPEYLQ